jgi:hypothetical protein
MKSKQILTYLMLFSSAIVSIAAAYFKFEPDFKFLFIYLFFCIFIFGTKIEKNMSLATLFLYLILLWYVLANSLIGNIHQVILVLIVLPVSLLGRAIIKSNGCEKIYHHLGDFFIVILFFLLIELVIVLTHPAILYELFYFNDSNQGYRLLNNKITSYLGYDIGGLNSIYFGAQSASQISLMSLVYFIFSYKRHTSFFNLFLIITSFIILFFSFTITIGFIIILILFITVLKMKRGVLFALIFVVPATIIFYNIIQFHYPDFKELIGIYVIDPYLLRFSKLDIYTLLFGTGFKGEIILSELPAELAILNLTIRLGLTGVVLLTFAIFIYPFLRTGDWMLRYLLIIGFFSLMHYPVSIDFPFIIVTFFIAALSLSCRESHRLPNTTSNHP